MRIVCLLLAFALQAPTPLAASSDDTVVILVRHAEKAAGPARDPDLSDAGQHRARALAERFAAPPLAAVYATQYRRTLLTAAPIAAAHGLPITLRPAGESADAFAALLRRRHAGQRVLVVGHSNTVPAIAAALSGQAVEPMAEDEYDRTLEVRLPSRGPAYVQQQRLAPVEA